MAEKASDRLLRMLGMITYLDRHAGVPLEQLADQFGVSTHQVVEDIDTLWVTGTPGYWPHDLIDFDAASYDEGVVRLVESRGMTSPLRLGTREAVALIAALRAMRAVLPPGLDAGRTAVLTSALDKLTAATGEAAAAVDVRLAVEGAPVVLAALGEAVVRGLRLRLRYVTAADVTSVRDVDPIRLLTEDQHSYLQAWCHRARDERLFRVDRILAAEVLDTPAATHQVSAHTATFAPDPDDELVTLELASRARWIAEQVPVERVENLPDGDFRVALRVADPAWLRHLLLRVADDVRSVTPARVAADAAQAARTALAAYAELGPFEGLTDARSPLT
ncbi:helix-turn-helix transcriptional regulator [Pengzhenrongella frigida]|uniref:WYL domain-containing protein n=1 Tax=Pengzhenrongella frigida TaxID=1259133 RepID=A0A4Q5N3U0_9MICO|nr:WYL domain-containing protein [Cellulomonas sp. HLT2-17]RYV50691.1 WYL domain-containing protein [Cellulomonas sp. HLT2-17]